MLKPMIIWGASGHAKVLREFLDRIGYQLVATFDNNPRTPPPFPDVPLYCGVEGFAEWRREHPSGAHCLVAIGGAWGKDRLEIQRFLESHTIRPAVAVHPTAFVASSARLAKGCQVLAQAAVGVEAELGEACIVNTSASVDHEAHLGEGVHIAPGATLSGCVTVGDFTLIGAGAVVLPRIHIGRNVVVGAGAIVTRDVPDGKIVYGNPARIIRDNVPEGSN